MSDGQLWFVPRESRFILTHTHHLHILDRGEGEEGYSLQFRHLEFYGALAAVLNVSLPEVSEAFSFANALDYQGTDGIADIKLDRFNQGMQFVELSLHHFSSTITRNTFDCDTTRYLLVILGIYSGDGKRRCSI